MHHAETFYNTHARPLTDIEIGSTVALQNQQTKRWDIYGKVVAIGPHRRYHVRTQSGRVLVRNRRFLRHRSPASCVPPTTAQQNPPTSYPNLPNRPATHTPSQETSFTQPPHQQRRSQRPHRAPLRLIEDPDWP